jgi:hypothetical protein
MKLSDLEGRTFTRIGLGEVMIAPQDIWECSDPHYRWVMNGEWVPDVDGEILEWVDHNWDCQCGKCERMKVVTMPIVDGAIL